VFKISAMSFGALSANAVLALNAGAKRGNFAHDTGEGSMQVAELAALEPVAGLKVVHAV